MALFLSNFENKVDQKGRVSVPASFRAALSSVPDAGQTLVLFRSHVHDCIEGFDLSIMDEMTERLDHFDMFSAEQDDLATVMLGEAVPLSLDGDGRITLPAILKEFAQIDGQASFVGLGRKFQIWQPEAFEGRRARARVAVNDKGLTLPRFTKGDGS